MATINSQTGYRKQTNGEKAIIIKAGVLVTSAFFYSLLTKNS